MRVARANDSALGEWVITERQNAEPFAFSYEIQSVVQQCFIRGPPDWVLFLSKDCDADFRVLFFGDDSLELCQRANEVGATVVSPTVWPIQTHKQLASLLQPIVEQSEIAFIEQVLIAHGRDNRTRPRVLVGLWLLVSYHFVTDE